MGDVHDGGLNIHSWPSFPNQDSEVGKSVWKVVPDISKTAGSLIVKERKSSRVFFVQPLIVFNWAEYGDKPNGAIEVPLELCGPINSLTLRIGEQTALALRGEVENERITIRQGKAD